MDILKLRKVLLIDMVWTFLIQGVAEGYSPVEVRLLLEDMLHSQDFIRLHEVAIIRELEMATLEKEGD